MENIRPLNPETDWEQYLQLNEFGAPLVYTYKQFLDQYEEILEQNSGIYTLVDPANKVLASGKLLVEFKFGKSVGHIEDIVVRKDERGKGYGKKIVKFLLERADEFNCYKTVLDCRNNLQEFYEKCGMKREGVEMVKRN